MVKSHVVEPGVCFQIIDTQPADQLRQHICHQQEKTLLLCSGNADMDFPLWLINSHLLSRAFYSPQSSSCTNLFINLYQVLRLNQSLQYQIVENQ